MLTPTGEVCPDNPEGIWVFFNMKNEEARRPFHMLREASKKPCFAEALDEHHYVLYLLPGGGLELLR